MKRYFCLSLLLLFVPFCFVGCKNNQTALNEYTIEISFDDQQKALHCIQTVDYINTSDNVLDEVRFHLYANAFKENAKASVVNTNNKKRCYYNGESFGNIEIKSVSILQNPVDFLVDGEDDNILTVPLFDKIYPDERVKIDMEYDVTLPNINHRFGYGENTINVGNFYPVACVYENGKGFVQDLYNSNGDPFYSEVASYKVKINYSDKFVLAHTGDVVSDIEQDGKRSTSILANNVRDFAFVLSDKYNKQSQSVDGINVNYYYYNDSQAEDTMNVAVKAIKTFGQMFGKYPYKSINITQSNFVHGGMEYPNLVLISDEISVHEDYEYVVVHELAHQWWYGVVGNNEYVDAWLDEGLAEYSTILFYEKNKEYNQSYDNMIKNNLTSYKLFVSVYTKINGSVDTSMNRRLDQFETEPEYTNCTYTKGVLLFDNLRQSIGDKKFFKCLAQYYKEYSFKIAKSEDLIASFIDSSGVELEEFFNSWIEGKVIIL